MGCQSRSALGQVLHQFFLRRKNFSCKHPLGAQHGSTSRLTMTHSSAIILTIQPRYNTMRYTVESPVSCWTIRIFCKTQDYHTQLYLFHRFRNRLYSLGFECDVMPYSDGLTTLRITHNKPSAESLLLLHTWPAEYSIQRVR